MGVTVETTHNPDPLSRQAIKNRAHWDQVSGRNLVRRGDQIDQGLAWGVWATPEATLQILGDVEGKDVLELGCGTGRWLVALARAGARPVGLDISPRQLGHAHRLLGRARVKVPLVEASAEAVPLPDESFDLVLSDHGAVGFSDPLLVVPEMARVLRPGGLFVFNFESPFVWLCWDEAKHQLGVSLRVDYFGLRMSEDDACVEFQLPYGEWIRLFRRCGFTVEDLVEPRPGPSAESIYRHIPLEWARRWPGENIWKVRKAG